ncbi:MAG: DUF4139 domain-containing protein [Bryobacterales bacterium]|nr:DUF4139 domain-containing protein [Bryobacterales bacterium]
MRKLLALGALGGVLMAAELPVRKVILYKHGVGYFERSGDLAAGESARLDFKASDMNDVLKSLTVEDKSGAKVTALRYDASEPVDKRLAEYPFAIGSRQALAAFLDQMKGSRLEVKTGAGQTVTGVIFGARATAANDKGPEKEYLTLLLDSGELHTFDMASVTFVKFTDEALQRQLKDYLATLAVTRSKDRRNVYIDSTDTQARQVLASYMIPMPSWKSSYRLILNDTASLLEGWAIVDNTTGEDWTNVSLAVVSGRPISFISKLYEPRYRDRPVAELAEERALAPTVYAGAVEAAPPPPAPMAAMSAPAGGAAFARKSMRMAAESVARDQMESNVAVETQGRELGDLFEYRFSNPVTVRKSESAMLPFLQQKINARKLLIYSDRSLQNPMSAAEITNTSGKTLDGGPITVYDSNAYAGEALVETFKAGDKRLISYGVDLGTRVTTNIDSSQDLTREIRANRGILTTKTALQETLTYTIRNVDPRAKTLIIEHPLRPEYKLLNQKPAETTDRAYRFEVKLAANASDKFAVSEEHVYEQSLALLNLNLEQLGLYIRNKVLSAEGRKQLEAVAAAKRQINAIDRQIRDTDTQINELVKDQERIRQNLTSLNRVTGQQEQVNKYATELAAQETRLAQMRDRQSELRKQKAAQEEQLNALIEKVSF